MKRTFIQSKNISVLSAVLLLTPGVSLHAADEAKSKPNIIVILADDLGYGDVQCYNPQRGKIPTPHIDKLASQGMRFTDGHSSSAVCSPSRYTLLTGRYHWRTKLQGGIVDVFDEPLIVPDRMTIGTLAQQNGYRTAAIGKWHLGWDWSITREQKSLLQAPNQAGKDDEKKPEPGPAVATVQQVEFWRGFFLKPIASGPSTRGFDTYFGTDVPNWPPFCFIENDRTLGIPSEFLPASDMGRTLASKQGPALKDWKLEGILPALGDRAVQFIDESVKKQKPFLLYLPLTSPHTPLTPVEEWKGKSGLNTYADFVMQTDATIGRVLDALEKSGAADKTLVIFTSDNGCAPYIGAKELEQKGHYPSGPLRGYKFDVWEGGHRIPFIVRWPGRVKPGAVNSQLVQQADVMATFAEILGTKLPENAGEDSFSFLSLLDGGDQPVRTHAVNCSVAGVPALRDGPWKLIIGPAVRDGNAEAKQSTQLYNLDDDLGETKNLASAMPEKVAEMKVLLEKLITDGRSTPGTIQKNDVEVKRYPSASSDKSKKKNQKLKPK